MLALSGSASGASLEVDNDQITNIDTDVAYDAYLVGWYGTGVLNIWAGGNASLTTITTSVIGGNENSKGTVNVLGGTWRLYERAKLSAISISVMLAMVNLMSRVKAK